MTERTQGAEAELGFRSVPGGKVVIGAADSPHPCDGETPERVVVLEPFEIARFAVTNRSFARFVADSGHVTDAETAGWSFVFSGFLRDDHPPTRRLAAAPWWRAVRGATWRAPEGPGSSLERRLDHPVVHVSKRDAVAYAAWAGARLPSEPEWEHAARGLVAGRAYPWGDELTPGGVHRCNVWQGEFPHLDTGEDGHVGTCPVDSYEPNDFGLFCMVGNVWELTADDGDGRVVVKGGSYLCHASYCSRYRVSSRTFTTADSTSGNTGFRLAR